MKKVYLATICFFPPPYAVLLLLVFLFRLPFPVSAFPYLMGYFFVGLIVLIIDLWKSNLPSDKKVLWTVLNLILGLVTLPVYWFVIVRRNPASAPEPLMAK